MACKSGRKSVALLPATMAFMSMNSAIAAQPMGVRLALILIQPANRMRDPSRPNGMWAIWEMYKPTLLGMQSSNMWTIKFYQRMTNARSSGAQWWFTQRRTISNHNRLAIRARALPAGSSGARKISDFRGCRRELQCVISLLDRSDFIWSTWEKHRQYTLMPRIPKTE